MLSFSEDCDFKDEAYSFDTEKIYFREARVHAVVRLV